MLPFEDLVLTRKGETDSCARVRFRVSPDAAAVGFNNRARKIQSQPRAFRLLDSVRRTIETIKNMWQILGFDTAAFIADANNNLLGAHTAADLDLALRRVLERIRNKI